MYGVGGGPTWHLLKNGKMAGGWQVQVGGGGCVWNCTGARQAVRGDALPRFLLASGCAFRFRCRFIFRLNFIPGGPVGESWYKLDFTVMFV